MNADHDPLCLWDFGACYCAVIAEARADERVKARRRVEALPHMIFCDSLDDRYSRPCNCPIADAADAAGGES